VTARASATIGVFVAAAVLSMAAFAVPVRASANLSDPIVRQPPVCRSQADLEALLAASAAAYNSRDAARGLTLLTQAFNRATADDCVVQRAEALLRLSLADSFYLRHEAARLKLLEAIEVFRQHGVADREAEALTQLGGVFVKMSRQPEAIEPLRRARTLAVRAGDRRLQLRILAALVYAVDEGPEKDELRQHALAFARAAPDGRVTECTVLHEWGDAMFARAQYAQAFPQLTEAVECFRGAGAVSSLARAYVSLGRVYRAHGRLDAALEQYARAIALGRDPGDPLSEVQSLNAIGVTLGALGRFDEGLERIQEALGLAQRLGSQPTVDFLRANIAAVHIERGRYADAATVLERTLAAPAPAYEIVRLVDLTAAYIGLRHTARALEVAERAVALAPAGQSERVSALAARANALIALGRFEPAAADLREAIEAVETIRANTVSDDYLKRGFSQTYQRVFASSISLAEKQGRPREAIEFAERARARAFLDLLASRTHPQEQGTRSLGAAPATFAEIAASAARLRSTVVAYWVGQAETFVWVVKADGSIASVRIPVTSANLVSMVRDATGVSSGSSAAATGMLLDAGAMGRPWRALYRLLVDPIRRHLPATPGSRLTIVPHGPLFGLPFAALRDAADRYLVESYEVHYVPAIGALTYTERSTRDAAARSAILIGDPGPDAVRDRVTALPSLPWADREVEAIGRLLKMPSTLLAGADATEARVRENMRGRTLLHFATHGIVQNEERLASYLALRPSPGVAGDFADGRLTANEAYGLDLDADLIVLSGCRTALGPVLGDGVIGFTRAFLAAGASSVMATMWDVPDRTSFEVMTAFYGSWTRGLEKGAALRQAQLSVIRALRAGKIRAGAIPLPESPRLWAGYVLVGQP
jgi:CHAT domain-containing protein/tetratricopeptide (TPR) repeat protein